MATTTNVSPLKINYLTQAQYDTALANNQINSNELYLTPAVSYTAGSGLSLTGTTFSAKTGYTTSGNNRKVETDSSGNLYVIQKDDNTTYTFEGGTNSFKVTPSGGTATTVTVTPSITNNITGSGTSGYLVKFNGTNTITNGPQLGSSTSTYLRNDGSWATPTNTTYSAGTGLSLSSTTFSVKLNSTTSLGTIGTTDKLYAVGVDANGKLCVNVPWSAGLSGTVAVSQGGTGNTTQTANKLIYAETASKLSSAGGLSYFTGNSTASAPAAYTRLHINGSTYGNTATNMISGTAGLFSFGDGGPQITFDTSATPGSGQAGALIYTDNDTAATGASWHFVSNQGDWNVTSKRFHARTSISIGTNLPNTSYNLYVNGSTYFNGSASHNGDIYQNSLNGQRWREHFYEATAGTSALGSGTQTFTVKGGRWGEVWYEYPRLTTTYATAGDASSTATTATSGGIYYWRQWSYNSSTADRLSYYEHFYLPSVTKDRTGNASYQILTTKNTLTIAQGGTGQTTAAGIFNVVRDNGGDSTWVNVTGDTMTGNLTMNNGISIRLNNGAGSAYSWNQIWSGTYADTSNLYIQADGYIGFYVGDTSNAPTGRMYVNYAGTSISGYLTAGSYITAGGDISTSNGLLKTTKNGNTTTIGSQNSGFCHIYNSANIPFIFNKTVASTDGDLGTSGYPWHNLYLQNTRGYVTSITGANLYNNSLLKITAPITMNESGYVHPYISMKATSGSSSYYWTIGMTAYPDYFVIWKDGSYIMNLHSTGIYSYGSIEAQGKLYGNGGWITATLETNGVRPDTDNTYWCGTTSYRWTRLYAANTSVSSSDKKDKDIIGNLDFANNLIMSLEPIEFMWKDGDHRRSRMGFIAQDVANVCKNMGLNLDLYTASYIEDKDMEIEYLGEDTDDENLRWGLSYEQLIAPLVKVVQNQKKEIDKLKIQNQKLLQYLNIDENIFNEEGDGIDANDN